MATFLQKVKIEYPVPEVLSIWGGDGIVRFPIEDINTLIETCVEEMASDILMTGYIDAVGMVTYMPEGTILCSSAKLTGAYPFQGNRLLKVTYDKAANIAYLRYYPATITYKRKLKLEDLEILQGDQLIYVKSYVLWKMAEKELSYLETVDMDVDHGKINLSVLESFRDKMHNRYLDLKPEILLYSSIN